MPVQLVFVPGARSQEVKMLCLLASGEHEALQGDMPKSWNIKPYIHKTNNSEASRRFLKMIENPLKKHKKWDELPDYIQKNKKSIMFCIFSMQQPPKKQEKQMLFIDFWFSGIRVESD